MGGPGSSYVAGSHSHTYEHALSTPDTLFREAKDMAEVLWEVSLEIEGECPLLHVQADLLKDHSAGRRRDKPFLLLLSWALLGCSDVG